MIFDYLDDVGCLAIIHSNGQVSVNEELINSKDIDNKKILEAKFKRICKSKNYYPKEVKAVKAIIFIEQQEKKKT